MDNAFRSLSEMLLSMSAVPGEISSPEDGFSMEIEKMSIETPVELWITTTTDGKVEIGCIPPLYHVDTTIQPSFHSITIHTEKNQL